MMFQQELIIIFLLFLEAMKKIRTSSVWKKVWKFCDFSIFFFKKWLSFMKGRKRTIVCGKAGAGTIHAANRK